MASTSKQDTQAWTEGAVDPSKVDVSIFYSGKGRGSGWAAELVKSLNVDEPQIVMAPATTKPQSINSAVSQAAKKIGIRVAMRTVEGQLLVMRLREDPAQPA